MTAPVRDRPAPAHLRPGRRVVKLHRHGSVLDGPDPCHFAALHRPTPLERLAAWPPRDAVWTSTYLRAHQAIACLVLLTAAVVALLANG